MAGWVLVGALLLTAVSWAADSSSAAVSASTSELTISARVIVDKEAVVKAVGSDLKRQYVIVELTVTPRGGYPVTISRDDFLLRSERDNERGTADSPDRVTGPAVLVLGSTGGGRPVYSQSGEPVFVGGVPGVPGSGRPRRIGTQDNTFGSGATGGGGESTVAASTSKDKPSPLIATLQQKELPLGEASKPVSGYLYFPVDPQQKTKNFHLHYKGAGGSCELKFK